MSDLLEIVLTFVATMLVLALVAQNLQDIVKFAVAWKGSTRLKALRKLLQESARAAGMGETEGAEITQAVIGRMNRLAQHGLRSGSLRLDVITREQLGDLVRAVAPKDVAALRPLDVAVGRARLGDVAVEAEKWFGLALDAVDERYRRRMRLTAFGSGILVVLAVNANAFDILDKARNDPRFRAAITQQATTLWKADSVARQWEDSLQRVSSDTTRRGDVARVDSLARRTARQRDSLAFDAVVSDRASFFGYPADFKPTLRWALGIVIAGLLVGLGAPFWHDLLESVFGLKNKVRAQAATAEKVEKKT